MFAHIKQYISSSINAPFLYRGIALFALLLVFATELKAQRYYVIYYDDATTTPFTRHYLAISQDGNSLTNETTLSPRCYWYNPSSLLTAQGSKGKDLYNEEKENYQYNQDNRKYLRSYVNTTKYINSDVSQNQATNGTERPIKLVENSGARWLFDNEIEGALVFFSYHYKHYVYYNNGWQLSSKGYEKSNIAKIKEVTLLKAPFANDIKPSGNQKLLVSLATEYNGTIYYSTDGSTPSVKYSAPFSVDYGRTVKTFAVNDNDEISSIATIVLPSSLTISLDDREDHTWSYYQEGSPISSPNPRNVKITYQGGGIEDAGNGNANAAVGIDAPETTFVYFKTLEKVDGKYPYTTIPNPFSKRPSKQVGDNPKQFYGFAGWEVISISEGTTITDGNTTYGIGATIPAETEIVFNFSSPYTTNCTSAEVTLEAVWEPACVVYCNVDAINAALSNSYLTGGTYEKNFVVLNNGTNSNSTNITRTNSSTTNKPATLMMVEPDGSADYRYYTSEDATQKRYINAQTITLYANTKFEYLFMDNNSNNTTINAGNKDLVLGRGVTSAYNSFCANEIRGINTNYNTTPLNYQLRIESGIFNNLTFVSKNKECGGTSKRIRSTLGSDYDRAKNDDTKLKILGQSTMGSGMTFSNNTFESSSFHATVKSGTFNANQTSAGSGSASQSFYISMSSDPTNAGSRTLIIEGGTFWNIAGGVDHNEEILTLGTTGYDKTSVYIRMKGGTVKGCVYGGGAYAEGAGNRKLIFTGGTVGGWIAAGCNGTQTSGGRTYGSSYVYVGGNTKVANQRTINSAAGGQIFGAGKGYASTDGTSGEMTYGTTVVVADNASIAGDVYGGGYYGYAQEGSSNVYVLGGTIGGNVYGGSNMKGGAPTNITIAGGTVNGDVYGGSNTQGEIASTSITMTGGTVGSDNTGGNIFGGGNQAPVKGNTSVTITGGEIKQNVYGGGNKAAVSGTTNVVIGQ